MRLRSILILLLAATACGGSEGVAGCAADADCPSGERCAAAPGGVCIPAGGTDAGADGGVDGGAGSDGGQAAADGGGADGGAPDGGSGGLADGGSDGGSDGGTRSCAPACAPSQVCTAALTCVDAYRVTLLTPVPDALVTGTVKVQARVDRGSPEVPLPTAVRLLSSRFASGPIPMAAGASDGLATLYSFDFPMQEGFETAVTFTVVAETPVGELRQAVTVTVDTWAPRQLGGLAISCDTGECNPGSVLTIHEEIADARLLSASASVELDGYARSFPFAPSGTGFSVSIPLRELPFPFYEKGVVVHLDAKDALGNASAESLGVEVRRFRWRRQLQVPHTTPAVMKDGTLVLGLSRERFQLLGLNQDGTDKWQVHLAVSNELDGGKVTAPPSIGASAIWAGSEDGRVYAVDLAGTRILNGVEGGRGCDTGGPLNVSPSLTYAGTEVAFSPAASGSVIASDLARCLPSDAQDPYGSSASLTSADEVIVVNSSARLLRYGFGFSFRLLKTVGPVGPTSVPSALDAVGSAWLGGTDGHLYGVALDGSIVKSNATAPISSSPVVAANGDIIFGDDAGVLHRYSPVGVRVWAAEPNLGAAVRAPMLLSGGDVEILVPTAAGKLAGVKGDGTVVWSTDLAPGMDLREGNLYTPPGQAGRVFSTAYFGCGDGNLYAVMVDGQLDAAAPWPRAHHDPQNTGNARGPRP